MTGTIEQRFEELVAGLTRKVDFDQWPDYIFFLRGDECLFNYNFSSGNLWCHSEKVWELLEREGWCKYDEVQSFLKNQIEKHFKLTIVTPKMAISRWRKLIEDHFKLTESYVKTIV